MKTDTERLDWLEKMYGEGNSPAIVTDDDGHWAVSFCGSQPCPRGGGRGYDEDVYVGVDVEVKEWKPTIREAIDYAIEQEG
ncbi:MAG: hypothetical protein ABFE13_11500 [Phycisphaerales bacterium]